MGKASGRVIGHGRRPRLIALLFFVLVACSGGATLADLHPSTELILEPGDLPSGLGSSADRIVWDTGSYRRSSPSFRDFVIVGQVEGAVERDQMYLVEQLVWVLGSRADASEIVSNAFIQVDDFIGRHGVTSRQVFEIDGWLEYAEDEVILCRFGINPEGECALWEYLVRVDNVVYSLRLDFPIRQSGTIASLESLIEVFVPIADRYFESVR